MLDTGDPAADSLSTFQVAWWHNKVGPLEGGVDAVEGPVCEALGVLTLPLIPPKVTGGPAGPALLFTGLVPVFNGPGGPAMAPPDALGDILGLLGTDCSS